MKDRQGRNISASTVAAEIMVYVIQRKGTYQDHCQAWHNLFLLLGLNFRSSMAAAVTREICGLASQCNPDIDPDAFMELAKDTIRDYARVQY